MSGPRAWSGSRWRWAGVLCALGWLFIVAFSALLADVLPLADPGDSVRGLSARTRPFASWPEFLGTDRLNRSVLSRVVYGARVSLLIGFGAAALGLVIGGVVGLWAGSRRGWRDAFVSTVSDAALAFPPIVLLVAFAAVRGPGISTLVLGLTVVSVPNFLRLARANTLRFASRDFIVAARVSGARSQTILFRELLPNILGPLLAYALAVASVLIAAEASISFLGLGVRPPTSSWGVMISDGKDDLETAPYLVFVPAFVLSATIYSVSVVSEWYRARGAP